MKKPSGPQTDESAQSLVDVAAIDQLAKIVAQYDLTRDRNQPRRPARAPRARAGTIGSGDRSRGPRSGAGRSQGVARRALPAAAEPPVGGSRATQ